MKIKLNGKKIYLTPSVRYLGIKIDSNLNWKEHWNHISIKLNRANAILSKLRLYLNTQTLRSVYYSLFESHFNYANIVWGQKINSSHRLFLIQKKAIRIMNFERRISHISPLFNKLNIVKFYNKISIENCVFISKFINNFLPSSFQNWFNLSCSHHSHHLRSSSVGFLKVPAFKTSSHFL